MFTDNEKLLRYSLIANATFSTLSGLALIIFDSQIDRLFALSFNYTSIGIMLLLFAAGVYFAGFRSKVNGSQVKSIIYMDIGWVVGSAILLLSPVSLSSVGVWSVIIVAIFVADFALFQYKGLKRVTAATST